MYFFSQHYLKSKLTSVVIREDLNPSLICNASASLYLNSVKAEDNDYPIVSKKLKTEL